MICNIIYYLDFTKVQSCLIKNVSPYQLHRIVLISVGHHSELRVAITFCRAYGLFYSTYIDS